MDLEDLLRTQSREGGSRLYGSVPDIGSFGLGTAPPPPPPMPGMEQAQDPQRREKPGYRPLELQKLQLLQKYAAMGLDPSFLAPFASEVTGGLDQRLADYRAKQQARKASLQSLSTLGPQAAELIGSGVPADAVDDMFQGFGGRVERGLDDIIGQMGAPGGASSELPQEEQIGIFDSAAKLAGAGVPLHEARMQLVGRARALGAEPAQLQATYDLIGQAYSSSIPAGGGARASQINAPMTFAEYQTPPQAAPAADGGGLDTLQQLLGQRQSEAVIGNDAREYHPASLGGLYERWFENLPGWWPGSPNA